MFQIKEGVSDKWLSSVRTLRRVSSLWSLQTNFSDVFDVKTGLPSCQTVSGGTLGIAQDMDAVPYPRLVPADVLRR